MITPSQFHTFVNSILKNNVFKVRYKVTNECASSLNISEEKFDERAKYEFINQLTRYIITNMPNSIQKTDFSDEFFNGICYETELLVLKPEQLRQIIDLALEHYGR